VHGVIVRGASVITGDVVGQLRKLKDDDAPDLWVHGSDNLIRTLRGNGLVDRMRLWTFPVLLGSGMRLFADDTPAAGWKLTDSTIATTGVIIATYEPAGEIKKGSFAE
jgi:dihydrofolate reductase